MGPLLSILKVVPLVIGLIRDTAGLVSDVLRGWRIKKKKKKVEEVLDVKVKDKESAAKSLNDVFRN